VHVAVKNFASEDVVKSLMPATAVATDVEMDRDPNLKHNKTITRGDLLTLERALAEGEPSDSGKLYRTGTWTPGTPLTTTAWSTGRAAEEAEDYWTNHSVLSRSGSLKKVMGEEMDDIKSVFKAIDKDGSGNLDHDEFRTAMERLGLGLTDEQLVQCIDVLDKDGDGEVSLEEFMALVKEPLQTAVKAISAVNAFAAAGANAADRFKKKQPAPKKAEAAAQLSAEQEKSLERQSKTNEMRRIVREAIAARRSLGGRTVRNIDDVSEEAEARRMLVMAQTRLGSLPRTPSPPPKQKTLSLDAFFHRHDPDPARVMNTLKAVSAAAPFACSLEEEAQRKRLHSGMTRRTTTTWRGTYSPGHGACSVASD